ncbi:MAG: nucleoside-diphosphate sugar epimerase/dehydratase [Pseudomonadota bacterium]
MRRFDFTFSYLSYRDLLVLSIDFLCCATAMWLAHMVLWPSLIVTDTEVLLGYSAGFGALCAIGLLLTGVNGAAWRYTSIPELVGLFRAIVGAALLFTVLAFLVSRGFALSRLAPVLAAVFSFVACAGLRILYRMSRERLGLVKRQIKGETTPIKNIALVGATNDADVYIRQTRRLPHIRINIVGIFDDRARWHGSKLQGARVVGPATELSSWQNRWTLQGRPASEIVITQPHIDTRKLARIVADAAKLRIPVRRLSNTNQERPGAEVGWATPEDIDIQDLLGRKEVPIDKALMGTFIEGKTILITGTGGSIGLEISKQAAADGAATIVLVENAEHALYEAARTLGEGWPGIRLVRCLADIRDGQRMLEICSTHQPDIVFHAAALKHVPLMETNRVECMRTNVIGTRMVADAAEKSGASVFVMISTDKAVNPTSIMGATKRAAEAYVQAKDKAATSTRYLTVRFGNVMDSNGSVIPLFRDQLNAGGPLTVTHPDIKRYFMTITEAVRLVIKASIFGSANPELRGSVYVLDMGESVYIREIAERMIQLAGFVPGEDIDIQYIGLRPGEKLNEDLFAANEPRAEIGDEGFAVASPTTGEITLISKLFDEMALHLAARNADAAIKLLRHLVPDYVPVAHLPEPARHEAVRSSSAQ